MIGWPSVVSNSWPTMRARASVADPAPKGMTNLMGFDGYACARASACDSDNSAASAATMILGMGPPLYLFFFVLVNASSHSGRQHSLRVLRLPSEVADRGALRVLRGIDSAGLSCLDWPSLVSKRRSSCFHRASVPQQLLTQTFGHQHSGNTRTPHRERPPRVASVGRDPISAAPGCALSVISSP